MERELDRMRARYDEILMQRGDQLVGSPEFKTNLMELGRLRANIRSLESEIIEARTSEWWNRHKFGGASQ